MEPICLTTPSPTSIVLRGGCVCGSVTYTSGTAPLDLTACHCIRCRKASGAPFMIWGLFHNAALTWNAALNVIRIDASEMAVRGTCSGCGTPLFMKYHCQPDGASVALGTLEDASIECEVPKLKMHIFLKEKARWWDGRDDGVQRHLGFDEMFMARIRDWEGRGRPKRADVR